MYLPVLRCTRHQRAALLNADPDTHLATSAPPVLRALIGRQLAEATGAPTTVRLTEHGLLYREYLIGGRAVTPKGLRPHVITALLAADADDHHRLPALSGDTFDVMFLKEFLHRLPGRPGQLFLTPSGTETLDMLKDAAARHRRRENIEAIGASYDVSGRTVLRWLKAMGVPLGARKLSAAQHDDIAERYPKGTSLAVLAVCHGVSPGTISTALKARQVPLRRPARVRPLPSHTRRKETCRP